MKVKYATIAGLLGLAASVAYGTMPPLLKTGSDRNATQLQVQLKKIGCRRTADAGCCSGNCLVALSGDLILRKQMMFCGFLCYHPTQSKTKERGFILCRILLLP